MSHHSTHRTLFQHYIRAGVQTLLARVQAAEHVVPELDRQQAWHLLSFALDVPEVWDVTRALLLALAPKMEQAGFRQSWMVYLVEAHERSHKMGDWQADAEFELQIGLQHRLSSHFSEARQWTKSSVEHFAALGDSAGERRALNELAWLEQLQHQYGDATQHAERALILSAEDDVERGMSYRVLGMIAIAHHNWQQAEAYHRKALALFEKLSDKRKVAWSLQNTGFALRGLQKYDEAIAYFQQAASILHELEDIFHWAIIQMNIGLAYMHSAHPFEAHPFFVRAEATFRQIDSKQFQAKVQINFGLNYLALNELSQAEQAFVICIELFRQLGDDSERLNAMDGLAMVYLAQKQFMKATKVLHQALSELPSIKNKPNFEYLLKSMHGHLEEASKGSVGTEVVPTLQAHN